MKVMKRLMALGIALVVMTAPVLATEVAWGVSEDPITWYFGEDADAIVSAESPSVGPVSEVTPTPVPTEEDVIYFTVKNSGKKYKVTDKVNKTVKLVKVKASSKKVTVPGTAKYQNTTYDVTAVSKSFLNGAEKVKKLVFEAYVKMGDFVSGRDTSKMTAIISNKLSEKEANKMIKRLNKLGWEGKIKKA